MTQDEWAELRDCSIRIARGEAARCPELRARYHELELKTRDVEEHPEGYDGPCLCRLCMSYAD